MPDILDWQRDEPRLLLQRALELLDEGAAVGLPTETSYGLALDPMAADAVRRLAEQQPEAPWRVLLSDPAELAEWLPAIAQGQLRLARRWWPGPVVLRFESGWHDGILRELPDPAQQALRRQPALEVLLPAHPATLAVKHYRNRPLLWVQPQPEAALRTSAELLAWAGDNATAVLDDGSCRVAEPPTVVTLRAAEWIVTAAGAVAEAELRQRLAYHVLFVCTGNTCRSPLAEALCKKLLAERLGCRPEELPARGFHVLSAGIAAMMEGEASVESVRVAEELGADLSGHRSQPLTRELLVRADSVFTMTRNQHDALVAHGSALETPLALLSSSGEDVVDPIGSDREVYRTCALQILQELEKRVPELIAAMAGGHGFPASSRGES